MGAITTITPILGCGFGQKWNDPPTGAYTNIAPYLRSWSITWGRATEWEQPRAGVATFVLSNDDRRFEPGYSTEYGADTIKPGVPIWFEEDVSDGSSTVVGVGFFGYAEGWKCTYPGLDGDPICVLTVADPLKLLSHLTMSGATITSGTANNMIGQVLTDVGWPTGAWRDLETAQTTLLAVTPDESETALDVISLIAQSDSGLFSIYYNPNLSQNRGFGVARFTDRHYLVNNYTSVFTLADSGTGIRYHNIAVTDDDAELINWCQVSRIEATPQTAKDATSIGLYGQRDQTISGLLLQTKPECTDRARHIVAAYGTPVPRVETIKARIAIGDDLTNQADELFDADELGRRCTVERRPDGGTVHTYDAQVARVRWSGSVGAPVECALTLGFVNSAASMQMWVLEDPVYGVLDSTTKLGW